MQRLEGRRVVSTTRSARGAITGPRMFFFRDPDGNILIGGHRRGKRA